MGSKFRKYLNNIGITSDKLVTPQEDDLIEEDGYYLEHDDKKMYLKKGEKSRESMLIQMVLGEKMTGVLTKAQMDLCSSILKSNIKGVNSQQYDFIISILNDSKAIKIAKNYTEFSSFDTFSKKVTQYTYPHFNLENTKYHQNDVLIWAPLFTSYVMQTAYPSWRYKSGKVGEWINIHFPRNNYVRRIRDLSNLKYNKVYIGGWVEGHSSGHMFFIDPIKTAKGSMNTIYTIEANTYTLDSYKNYSVTKRCRKFHSGSKIKIYEITI